MQNFFIKSRVPKIVVLLFAFLPAAVQAQNQPNQTYSQRLMWMSYFQNIEISPKYHVQAEVGHRRLVDSWSENQSLVRIHVRKPINNIELSAGGSVFWHHPSTLKSPSKLTIPELRPHLELMLRQKFSTIGIDHRYRMESRFFHQTNGAQTELENGFELRNIRFRYRLQVIVPLKQKTDTYHLSLRLFDEILLQTSTNNTIFDQNRIALALSLTIKKNHRIDVGYMHYYQQKNATSSFVGNVLYVNLYHTLKIYKHSLKEEEN